jgi:hypothetical protein
VSFNFIGLKMSCTALQYALISLNPFKYVHNLLHTPPVLTFKNHVSPTQHIIAVYVSYNSQNKMAIISVSGINHLLFIMQMQCISVR